MAVVPPTGANSLRAALKTKRWSYGRLAAELRRQAIREAVTVPKRESLVTLITRWVNNAGCRAGRRRGAVAAGSRPGRLGGRRALP